MTNLKTTREAFVKALSAVIVEAPDSARERLAQALEDFAQARGRASYERATTVSPLVDDLFAAIEEASDARLFA